MLQTSTSMIFLIIMKYICLILFLCSCSHYEEEKEVTVFVKTPKFFTKEKGISDRFEDRLLELRNDYLIDFEPWVDLLVMPLKAKDSTQSILLVAGVYLPSESDVFSGFYHDGKRRVIFLNLEKSIFNIVDENKLQFLNPKDSIDDFSSFGAITPVFKYINIYNSDSLVISDSSI